MRVSGTFFAPQRECGKGCPCGMWFKAHVYVECAGHVIEVVEVVHNVDVQSGFLGWVSYGDKEDFRFPSAVYVGDFYFAVPCVGKIWSGCAPLPQLSRHSY